MTQDEYTVWLFLSASPESAFSRREIARRAVKRREFEANPHWADTSLSALVARGVLETTQDGAYRIKRKSIG
jgi:hypothetical protein